MKNIESGPSQKDPFEARSREEMFLPDVTDKQRDKINEEFLRVTDCVEDVQADIEEEYNVDIEPVMKELYAKSRDILRASGLPQDETLLRTILLLHAKTESAEQAMELEARGDRKNKVFWKAAEKI